MDTLIHADIFFFITSIAVVVFTVCLVMIMPPLMRILRNLDRLAQHIRKEEQAIVADIQELRETLRDEGDRIRSIADFFLGFFPRSRKRSNRSQSHITTHKKHE